MASSLFKKVVTTPTSLSVSQKAALIKTLSSAFGLAGQKRSKSDNVGILGMEIYYPRTYVKQCDLEVFDGVGEGKYTVGLGQRNMAFCDDREDINSMALTAVQSLLEKYNVHPNEIGRLEVGTETIIDKSKSLKTTLMSLFPENPSLEGVTNINACYGGTAALFNSLNWLESSSSDGRYALVVAGDIAVYEPGPARPTGGAAVVAMLLGPNAPLALEPRVRGTYVEDAYDFYKPNLESEYPIVDGKMSNTCYLRALDSCYNQYATRHKALYKKSFDVQSAANYVLFHSPYHKLVQRSYARLLYNDFLNKAQSLPELEKFRNLSKEESYVHKELTKALDTISVPGFDRQVAPSTDLPRNLGNSYCGSLYAGLISLLGSPQGKTLDHNQRLLLFSYGSGLVASMFSFQVNNKTSSKNFSLSKLVDIAQNVNHRLSQRVSVAPQEFSEVLSLREKTHAAASYKPQGLGKYSLFPGTFQLEEIDSLKRRVYKRV